MGQARGEQAAQDRQHKSAGTEKAGLQPVSGGVLDTNRTDTMRSRWWPWRLPLTRGTEARSTTYGGAMCCWWGWCSEQSPDAVIRSLEMRRGRAAARCHWGGWPNDEPRGIWTAGTYSLLRLATLIQRPGTRSGTTGPGHVLPTGGAGTWALSY